MCNLRIWFVSLEALFEKLWPVLNRPSQEAGEDVIEVAREGPVVFQVVHVEGNVGGYTCDRVEMSERVRYSFYSLSMCLKYLQSRLDRTQINTSDLQISNQQDSYYVYGCVENHLGFRMLIR